MKHVVVLAHPKTESFVGTLARDYCDQVRWLGHEVFFRDLYAIAFEPRLAREEMPGKGFAPRDDIKAERQLIADADVFAFFYPFWFNAPPAIMKGYMERVFGLGFAYNPDFGGTKPLLTGRKLFSVSASGAPTEWMKNSGGLDAERSLFDAHFAAVCGLSLVDHLHFGGIVPGMRKDVVDGHVATLHAAVSKHFRGSTLCA